jgi:hypothetical protein
MGSTGRRVMNTKLNTMIYRHANLNYCLWHSETSDKASSTRPVASPTAPPSKSKARTIRRPIPLHMVNSSQQIPLQRIPETRHIWRVPQDLPRAIRTRTRVARPCVQAHRLPARAATHFPHRLDTQPLRLLYGNQAMRVEDPAGLPGQVELRDLLAAREIVPLDDNKYINQRSRVYLIAGKPGWPLTSLPHTASPPPATAASTSLRYTFIRSSTCTQDLRFAPDCA